MTLQELEAIPARRVIKTICVNGAYRKIRIVNPIRTTKCDICQISGMKKAIKTERGGGITLAVRCFDCHLKIQ